MRTIHFHASECYRIEERVKRLSYPYRHTYKCKICQDKVTTLLIDYSFYFLKLNYKRIIEKYNDRVSLNCYNLSKHFKGTPHELIDFWFELYEKPRKDWVDEMLAAYALKPRKSEAFEDFFELC